MSLRECAHGCECVCLLRVIVFIREWVCLCESLCERASGVCLGVDSHLQGRGGARSTSTSSCMCVRVSQGRADGRGTQPIALCSGPPVHLCTLGPS